MISPAVFFIFFKYWFFGLLWQKKGKKLPKMKNNNYIRYVPYLRNSVYSIWSWFLVYLCKMMMFSYFFKILIFLVVRGVKGQKIVQNDKNSVSHASYLRNHKYAHHFVVWKCKMMISAGVLFIFLKLWFFRLLGGSKSKNGPKWQKTPLSCLIFQEPCTYVIG